MRACRHLKSPDDKIAMHAASAVWHACKGVLAQSEKFTAASDVLAAGDLPCRNYVHLTLWAYLYPPASPRADPPVVRLAFEFNFVSKE